MSKNEITEIDIQFWEAHLEEQIRTNKQEGIIIFCEHLLKLAKAVKEIQSQPIVEDEEN